MKLTHYTDIWKWFWMHKIKINLLYHLRCSQFFRTYYTRTYYCVNFRERLYQINKGQEGRKYYFFIVFYSNLIFSKFENRWGSLMIVNFVYQLQSRDKKIYTLWNYAYLIFHVTWFMTTNEDAPYLPIFVNNVSPWH